jgi:tetratricopeptide (TPR) repeat protein
LKGLYEQNRGSVESNEQAIIYFQRAVQQNPDLALAWAGLSISQNFVTGFADTDFRAGFEEARTSALRALEIDPDLPEGHVALAGIQKSLDWDWEAAEASLNRALALRPGDTRIRRNLANLMSIRGKPDVAASEYQRVVEQDPLDWRAQRMLATALAVIGHYDRSSEIFDHLQELDPNRPALYWGRGALQLRQGNYQQALNEFSLESLEFLKLTGQAISYHHLQQQDQAETALNELISSVGESASYQIANVYAQWGDADNALSWLEHGYKIRDPGLQYLGDSFLFSPIQEDPRFQAFLNKMNLGGQTP